jgi:RNA polymerase sigma-70 factor (ECF subfamily)
MGRDDAELIQQIQDGDAGAFDELFARYHDAVRRRLRRIVRQRAIADDLAQETFLRVWTRAEQWHAQGSFRGWLFRIATNLALNHLRSVRRRRQRPLDVPQDLGDTDEEEHVAPAWMIDASTLGPDVIAQLAEEEALMRRLVERLPEDKREVFRLAHEAEMPVREIAEGLGLPEGTVKSRLHYARKRLTQQWDDLNAE